MKTMNLNQAIFNEHVTIWQGVPYYDKQRNQKIAYRFASEILLKSYVERIADPDLLSDTAKDLVKDAQSDPKKKLNMFGFCPSTFKDNKRNRDSVNTFLNVIQFDLDLKNEPDCTPEYVTMIKNSINNMTFSSHIVFISQSISGKGVYFLLATDTNDYYKLNWIMKSILNVLQTEFKFKSNKTLDECTKDFYTRIRYYSPDPDIIVNDNIIPLDTSSIIPQKKKIEVSESEIIDVKLDDQLKLFQKFRTRHLGNFSNTVYESGFHDIFAKKFVPACLNNGITSDNLTTWVTKLYGNLYNDVKREDYLPELLRVIDHYAKVL